MAFERGYVVGYTGYRRGRKYRTVLPECVAEGIIWVGGIIWIGGIIWGGGVLRY